MTTTTKPKAVEISAEEWEALHDDIERIKSSLDEVLPGTGSAGNTLESRVLRLERNWNRVFGQVAT